MTEVVFIGGAGRSGTTFLAHQLSQYDGITTAGENQWLVESIERRIPDREFSEFCRKHWKVRTAPNRPTNADWREIQRVADREGRAAAIIRLLSSLTNGSGVIVDHTPWNLARMHIIDEVFPNARYLHIVRDGRAVFASLKRVTWGPNTPPQAAAYWESAIARGILAEYHRRSRIERIYYEDLLAGSELGEEIAGRLLSIEPGKLSRKVDSSIAIPNYTSQQHSLVNLPPQRDRITAWQDQLSTKEISAFEQLAGASLSLLGYHLHADAITTPGHGTRLAWAAWEFINYAAINPVRNIVRTRGQHLR